MDTGVLESVVMMIQSIGFPISVACLAFWYIKYREDRHDEENRTTQELHKAEVEKMSEAVNNNTLILTKLYERLNEGQASLSGIK